MKIKNQIIKILITIILSFESNDESISTCKKAPKYLLKYYIEGETITFNHFINRDSVHPLIEKEIAGGGKKYDKQYLNRLGPYFTFVGIGGAAFICWIFLIFCWFFPKCCYRADEGGPALKLIMLIVALTFLFGIIACCISGFVFTERFKKNLNGSTCAIERLYYNIYDGQILNSSNPIWIGFSNIIQQIYQLNYLTDIFLVDGNYELSRDKIDEVLEKIDNVSSSNDTLSEIISITNITNEINQTLNISENLYSEFLDDLYELISTQSDSQTKIESITNSIKSLEENFEVFGDKIVSKYNSYKTFMKKFIYICFHTLYSFTLTFATLEIFFSFCILINHSDIFHFFAFIFWFLIMLLSVTSFFIGACYGMINFGIKDGIGYLMYVFGLENMNLDTPIIISKYKDFIDICIHNKTMNGNLSLYYGLESEDDQLSFRGIYDEVNSLLVEIKSISISDTLKIISTYKEKDDINDNEEILELLNQLQEEYSTYSKNLTYMTQLLYKKITTFFQTYLEGSSVASVTDNPFSFMNCSFIKNDLQATYKALFDLSEKVKVLTALTLCIAFFGLIAGICLQIALMRYKDLNNSDYYEIDDQKESSIYKKNKKVNDSKKNPQLTRLSELQEFEN